MLIIAHLSLMITGTLCLIAGIGMAMFGRKKKFWLRWHRNLNSAGVGLIIAGGTVAFVNVMTSDSNHLAGIHQWSGLAALILACLTLFLGFYFLKAANKQTVRTAHRWSGRLSLIALTAALILGLIMIGIL